MSTLSNPFLASIKETAPSIEAFKSIAKNTHTALAARGVPCKLSDIQEGMAAGYGFENYATFLGLARREEGRLVEAHPGHEDGFFIALLVDGCLWDHNAEEAMVMLDLPALAKAGKSYTPCRDNEARLDSFYGRSSSFYRYDEDFVPFTNDLSVEESGQLIVTSVFVECPDVEKYGTPHFGDGPSLAKRVLNGFHFGVYKYAEPTVHSSGDDSFGYTIFEVFVPNSLAGKVLGTRTAESA